MKICGYPRRQGALVGICALLLAGCQTESVALSPPMHARVVDGVTKNPLYNVRVTLISRDGPETATAFSDNSGFVNMPALLAQSDTMLGVVDRPRAAVHAIFQYPGYVKYTIDSVNGYGYFRGYYDVHLYPD